MIQKTLIFIPSLILCLYVGGRAQAFETGDILIHGFFSQGYLKSDTNNYLGDSEDGSYEFNEVGLNFTVPLTDALRFGVQFFSRDIGDYGNNELQVDWGFMDYKWQDYLGFRAGKIKMPFGLYNRQRDADMLRTSILLPQSVYIEEYRDMIVAFQGASLYGIVRCGMMGYLDYEVFTGTTELEGYSVEFDQINGGLLTWNTPVSGLRLGNTYMYAEGTSADTYDFSADPVRVFSAEFEKGPLLISTEYARLDAEIDDQTALDIEGWYASVSWQALEWLDLGVTYSEYYPDNDDKNGKFSESIGNPDYYAWQKDTTLSVRFNISEWWAVKLETHFMDGVGLLKDKMDSDETWTLYAVKTSLTF